MPPESGEADLLVDPCIQSRAVDPEMAQMGFERPLRNLAAVELDRHRSVELAGIGGRSVPGPMAATFSGALALRVSVSLDGLDELVARNRHRLLGANRLPTPGLDRDLPWPNLKLGSVGDLSRQVRKRD